mmetsp:Transcript_63935/g.183665  ORF Transcript_63935/g.183665 Transcript_63935/m.183665 type:complete len:212 (+) Transcript_63935:110-745(+)
MSCFKVPDAGAMPVSAVALLEAGAPDATDYLLHVPTGSTSAEPIWALSMTALRTTLTTLTTTLARTSLVLALEAVLRRCGGVRRPRLEARRRCVQAARRAALGRPRGARAGATGRQGREGCRAVLWRGRRRWRRRRQRRRERREAVDVAEGCHLGVRKRRWHLEFARGRVQLACLRRRRCLLRRHGGEGELQVRDITLPQHVQLFLVPGRR